MVDSLWLSNVAQYGGALYADEGCSLSVHNTTFGSNYAQVSRSSLPPVVDGVVAASRLNASGIAKKSMSGCADRVTHM
jgi:predicted outer membrane repeat protein